MPVDIKTPEIILQQITKNASSGIPYSLSAKDGVKVIAAIQETRQKCDHFEEQCDFLRRMLMQTVRLFGGEVALDQKALGDLGEKSCALNMKQGDGHLDVVFLIDEEPVLRVGDIVHEPKKNKKWLVSFVGDCGDCCLTKVSAKAVTTGRIVDIDEVMKWKKDPREDIKTAEEVIKAQQEKMKPKSNIILPT